VSGSESGDSRQNAHQDGIGAKSNKQDERLSGPQQLSAAKSVSRAKKRSGAVQVVVEEGQRQQEMNFADQGEMQLEEREDGDRDRLDLAVDDLGGLEDQLKQGEGVSG
jgi:type IV secretion system protein VirD4